MLNSVFDKGCSVVLSAKSKYFERLLFWSQLQLVYQVIKRINYLTLVLLLYSTKLKLYIFNCSTIELLVFNFQFYSIKSKDERVEVSFSSVLLNWIHKVERWDKLNFTMWNFFIQVEFHSVKFLNSICSKNWTGWLLVQFNSLQLVYSNGIHRLKWKMNFVEF